MEVTRGSGSRKERRKETSQSVSQVVVVLGGQINLLVLLESVIEDGNVNHVVGLPLENEATSGRKSPAPRVEVPGPAVRVRDYHVAWRKFRVGRRKRVHGGAHAVVNWRVMDFLVARK